MKSADVKFHRAALIEINDGLKVGIFLPPESHKLVIVTRII